MCVTKCQFDTDKVSVCTAGYKLLNHSWSQEPHPGRREPDSAEKLVSAAKTDDKMRLQNWTNDVCMERCQNERLFDYLFIKAFETTTTTTIQNKLNMKASSILLKICHVYIFCCLVITGAIDLQEGSSSLEKRKCSTSCVTFHIHIAPAIFLKKCKTT